MVEVEKSNQLNHRKHKFKISKFHPLSIYIDQRGSIMGIQFYFLIEREWVVSNFNYLKPSITIDFLTMGRRPSSSQICDSTIRLQSSSTNGMETKKRIIIKNQPIFMPCYHSVSSNYIQNLLYPWVQLQTIRDLGLTQTKDALSKNISMMATRIT